MLFDMIEAHEPWIGLKFHLLTVKRIVRNRLVPQFWCRCGCGNEVVATATELTRGRVTSCGHCQRPGRKTTSIAKRRATKR